MQRAVLAAVAVSCLLPGAGAAGVPSFVDVRAGENGEVSGVMTCQAPGFINCSLAMAAAVAGCATFPFIGEVCVGVGVGVIGSVSSLAVPPPDPSLDPYFIGGGGATGWVMVKSRDVLRHLRYLDCDWQAASGACFKGSADLGFICPVVHTTANGYLATVNRSKYTDVLRVPAPPAATDAAPSQCATTAASDALLVTPLDWASTGMTSGQIATELRTLLAEAVHDSLLETKDLVLSEGYGSASDGAGAGDPVQDAAVPILDEAHAGVDAWANGLTVDGNYIVSPPPHPYSFGDDGGEELRVGGLVVDPQETPPPSCFFPWSPWALASRFCAGAADAA